MQLNQVESRISAIHFFLSLAVFWNLEFCTSNSETNRVCDTITNNNYDWYDRKYI